MQPVLGNGSVNTFPLRLNDITPQQYLVRTWLVFSGWSALRNSRTVFSVRGPCRRFIEDNEGSLEFTAWEYNDEDGACLSD
jgi:hypothetical protein